MSEISYYLFPLEIELSFPRLTNFFKYSHRKTLSIYHVYIQLIKIKVTSMAVMSAEEIKKFLMQGTFTGKLATTNKDGSPHIVPIWFVLNDNHKDAVNEREKIGYEKLS